MKKVKAKKSLGQNFLADADVIARILEAAKVTKEDKVLEIGPGTGILTQALSPRVQRLVAIELDHELVKRLQDQYINSKKVSILEGNILEIHLEELLESLEFEHRRYKIIANIPYYITAPIIRTLLALDRQPQSMTLMVQDEVADRLTAEPGAMSLLSLMAQYYATVEKKFVVPKIAFDPMPKVESAVISIVPKRAYSEAEDRALFRLARAGFAARRKTLVNNFASSFKRPREHYSQVLENIGIRKDVRAQALSVSDWQKLTLAVNEPER